MNEPGRLHGLAAVVTGANQGIGAAIARAFAAEGARLCLLDRRGDHLAEVAGEARALGVEAWHAPLDVTDGTGVEAALAEAAERFGRLDVLVNCAGVFHAAPIAELTRADFERVMAVNVTGTLLCIQAALRHMLPRGSGSIVNFSSIAGRRGNRYVTAYSAAKHAVLGITRCVAMEVAGQGIRVNAICPGYIDTEMYDGVLREIGGREGIDDPERFRAMVLKAVPLGRMIAPAEVARLAVYLAAPESAGMTGQALTLDGGLVMV
jgi:D-sorbitol dehydrogenase (acceptor)